MALGLWGVLISVGRLVLGLFLLGVNWLVWRQKRSKVRTFVGGGWNDVVEVRPELFVVEWDVVDLAQLLSHQSMTHCGFVDKMGFQKTLKRAGREPNRLRDEDSCSLGGWQEAMKPFSRGLKHNS